MLVYAIVFLMIVVIAGLLSFGILVTVAVTVARVLFWVFLILFLISLVVGSMNGRGPP